MIAISHEFPYSLIEEHQDFLSDYMFALLHKAIEDPKYLQRVCEYRDAGGIVYLDNSCFELGESMDNDKLYHYFEIIKPELLVLPDTLGNKEKTISRSKEFLKQYPDTIHHAMAVIQGSSPEEMVECYREFTCIDGLPWIGIPFVYSWAEKTPTIQATERIRLLEKLEPYIDTSINHHLLGTWQAREFMFYRDYDWIRSLDTSNPVMAALDGTMYTEFGIKHKPKSTFDSTYHLKESEIDLELLYYNVNTFKEIVHGRQD
jgi:hypothetical protein